MIREEKIGFTTRWAKYSKYKMQPKGEVLYLLPDDEAELSVYDPFEYANDMLKDILTIGKEVLDDDTVKVNDLDLKYEILSKEKYYQDSVLEFVNKYGLVGNFRYLPKNYAFIDNPELELFFDYDDVVTGIDFQKRYFGFDPNADWNPENIYLSDLELKRYEIYHEQMHGDLIKDIIFSKYYAETVSEILKCAAYMYSLKNTVYTILYTDISFEKKRLYILDLMSCKIKKVSLGYTIRDRQFKFEWLFNSLRAIMETILLLNETNNRTEVKLCKFCKKPFIAKNVKAEYDTPQCRNKANIYKSRNKKTNN